jgi:AcrR family transcriptional regulator
MKKGERTRQAIIEAAQDLFFEKGPLNVSAKEVALRANITQPAVYAYFKSMEELLAAACLDSVQRGRAFIDARLLTDVRADERLRSYLVANLEWITENRRDGFGILLIFSFGISSPALGQLHRQIDEGSITRLETHLKHGVYEGTWKFSDTAERARALHNLLTGEMIKALRSPQEVPIATRIDRTWATAHAILTAAPTASIKGRRARPSRA